MTAPLPLPSIAPAAPASIADALGAKPAPANKKGPSFSDVLAQQRPSQQRPGQASGSRPAEGAAKTPAKGQQGSKDPAAQAENAAAGAIDEAVQTAAQSEAGALAVAAAQPAAVLPQQALEIAAQAAEQVQLARGNAAAAAAGMNTGAAVLTATLGAADAAIAVGAPVASTAQQAEAAAAIAVRDAAAALPVVTEAVKPGSPQAPVQAPAAPAAGVKADAPRLAPETALPRPAGQPQADIRQAPAPALEEQDPAVALAGADPQFQAPQHGPQAHEMLAPALAAAAQRQPLPVANPAAIAAPAVPLVLQVATPVGGTHWGTELGQQVVMMSHNARQGMQTAELRLDPPDLGPLRVSLNLADGVASASFVSAHASVRQAIETAIPQLQQALAQAGISLGQTSVGEQAAQQEFAQQGGNGSQRQSGGSMAGAAAVAEAPVAVTVARNANALVDTFA
ncbi:flagellar hook-length control protein [Achromobacter sp. RTa]|uniref:flagellar hook-length control protein FliK n=1 Tax=Achromobacter sp. RTa TaxID=1532557 RepID=UPI0005106C4B|nr:flagellar hook-length control protein FliK [Achromobacter sp. RTa]KGD92942.1 flagellar hook-length control protein [Achromobacter sp. RTa]